MKKALYGLFLVLILIAQAWAENDLNLSALSQLRRVGLKESKLEQILTQLTDGFGPRLTGSENLRLANLWVADRLKEWGLRNVRLEPWGDFGRGWEVRRCVIEMLEPYYAPMIGYPKAWTEGLAEPIEVVPVLVEISEESDFAKYSGRLKGSVVLLASDREIRPEFEADAMRFTDDELDEMERASPAALPCERRKAYRARREFRKKRQTYLEQEGVAAILEMGQGADGTVFVGSGGSFKRNERLGLPTLVLTAEHHQRLQRILQQEARPRIRIELDVSVDEEQLTQYNVLGDIPGTDPIVGQEMVMLGGHLDSWHTGTGATDNAAGCAAALEAVRLIASLGLRPKRTVRLALWSGEEQGLLGSKAYVNQHLGDAGTGNFTKAHGRLSAYFNLDNGTGRIRGVYLQGNDAVRPIFQSFLEPVRDLSVQTLTIRDTRGTDHLPFDAVGIPAFQFIQDPVSYDSRTHHSNMDVYDHALVDDLQQAAVVLAWFTYSTANHEQKLPRKPWSPLATSNEDCP